MRARAAVRFAAAFQALLLMATLLFPALAAAAEITTDLWVYQYGDTVTVTGVDFGADEDVVVATTDPAGTTVDSGVAHTDGTGSFAYSFTLVGNVPGIYDVVATGESSGLSATTQFDPHDVAITSSAAGWKKTVAGGFDVAVTINVVCSGTSGTNRCTAITSLKLTAIEASGSDTYSKNVAIPTVPTASGGTDITTTFEFRTSPGAGQFAIPDDGRYHMKAEMTYTGAASGQVETPDQMNNYFGVNNLPPAPVITPSGTLGTNGWYTSNVSFSIAPNDPTPGDSVSCTAIGGLNADTAGTLVSTTCTDAAGNTGSASSTIKLDKTAPSPVSLSVAGDTILNGWYNAVPLTITTSGTEPTSTPITCTAPQTHTSQTGAGGVTFNGSCQNDAGLFGSNSVNIKVDLTAPSSTLSSFTAPASGVGFTFSGTSSDALAGMDVEHVVLRRTSGSPAMIATSDRSVSGGPGNWSWTLPGQVAGDYCLDRNAVDLAGNDESVVSYCFTIVAADSTAPVISKVITGTSGANGWYTSNVSVAWSVTDPDSAVVVDSGCGTQNFTSETAAVTSSCAAHSAGGSSSDSVNLKIDKTAPSVALSVTAGTAGSNGWYTSDVTVHTAGTESISGPVTCTEDQFQATETMGTVFNGQCTNDAGLSADATPLTIKLDKTGPSAALSVTVGTAGSNGWYTSDVTVHTAGSDLISGPVSCSADQFQTTDTTGATFDGSCTNDAGLTTDATALVLKLDKTAPTVTVSPDRAPDSGSWYTSDVTFDTAGTDGTSGVLDTNCTSDQTYSGPAGTGLTMSGSCTDEAGNTGSNDSDAFDFDSGAPTVAISTAAVADSGTGWFNIDSSGTGGITIDVTTSDDLGVTSLVCTDDTGSSPVSVGSLDPTGDSFVLTDGQHQIACHASDAAANHGYDSDSFDVDQTDPYDVAGAPDRAPDFGSWYNHPVDVVFDGDDDTSGIDSCTTVAGYDTDGTGVSVQGSCTDLAGNTSAPVDSSTFDYDNTDPAVTVTAARSADHNGWYNAPVSFDTAGTDGTSDVSDANCTVDQNYTGPDGLGLTVGGSCTDNAGNTGTGTSAVFKFDDTNPGISLLSRLPAANGFGWNKVAVTATWSCSDATSGPIASSVSDTKSSEGSAQIASGTCEDTAGNTAGATLGGINIDLTAPSVSLVGGPANGGSYYFGSIPAAPSCSASDALSGLDGACSVGGYETTVGMHTVTASASDKAGNGASEAHSYTVLAWTLTGFYNPVDMGSMNTVKGGSTVPLKFDVFAGPTELTSVSAIKGFKAVQMACDALIAMPSDEIEITSTGGTSLRYDSTSGQFIQNWQTPKNKVGTCWSVTMTAQDGSWLFAYFKLK